MAPTSPLLSFLLQGLLASSAWSKKTIPLEGHPWTLSNPALNITVPASLPSQAHLDLYAAGVIGDPYHDLNDFNLRWVAWNNWTYTSGPIEGLSSSPSGQSNDSSSNGSTWLVFDGLDTFVEISFCGQHVGRAGNQFRQWWFDVSDVLTVGCAEEDAVIELNFGSATKIADQIAEKPEQRTWPQGVQQVFEFPNRWFIRYVHLPADFVQYPSGTAGGFKLNE